MRITSALAAALVLFAPAVRAQEHAGHAAPQPPALEQGLSELHHPVSTKRSMTGLPSTFMKPAQTTRSGSHRSSSSAKARSQSSRVGKSLTDRVKRLPEELIKNLQPYLSKTNSAGPA